MVGRCLETVIEIEVSSVASVHDAGLAEAVITTMTKTNNHSAKRKRPLRPAHHSAVGARRGFDVALEKSAHGRLRLKAMLETVQNPHGPVKTFSTR
jgi:hypothetical protein